MTTFSANSRLNMMNLKDRKSQNMGEANNTQSSNIGSGLTLNDNEPGLKLTISDPTSTYEPTNAFTSSRTQMRMLKGKIERGPPSVERQPISNKIDYEDLEDTNNGFVRAPLSTTEMNHTFKPKPQEKRMQLNNNGFGQGSEPAFETKQIMSRPPLPQTGLKLVLPDEQPVKEQRKPFMINPQPEQKEQPSRRILIADANRGESRDKKIMMQQPEKKEPEPPVQVQQPPISKPSEQKVVEVKPIEPIGRPEQPEIIQNQNELVQCPEGCGRKFNRKALETHAKACKIVFMSKRKEFNSQAKRVTNKEQASLVKQAKQKEKKEMMGTGKFQKTGQAWKTQSEGFRAVVKALKQEDVKVEEEQVKVVTCQYCEKIFNEILYSKHLPICEVKKEKQKKMPKKASKKM